MERSRVTLTVPAKPAFARSVRMMAANLAVLCSMSVDDVEDARMAAEEAFVYACATHPEVCRIDFDVTDDGIAMEFSLGGPINTSDANVAEQVGLAQVLLTAVSDSFEVSPEGDSLHVTKLAGEIDAY